jgi:anaerobic selenocysteine-containing dehydrogenase
MSQDWKATACILCSENCGLEVRTEGTRITAVRGDAAHPDSRGYLCQKASRLDYYQNHGDRLTSPLRRNARGEYEPISWDEAISEIARRLRAVRDEYGGHALAYYGGGGQGNHLGGVYGSSLRAAMGTPYIYSALAQEKTGDFWVNGRLFGRQTCHVTQGVADADFVLFCGTNPWQSHGVPRARVVLKEIRKDPARTMVVLDPRRTETAEMADVHLQLRPGTDAFLMAAILGIIVQEGLENTAFLAERTVGHEKVLDRLREVPVDAFIDRAGVDRDAVRQVARGLAAAKAATVRADLGIQQSLHSTLNSYLEKLLFLIPGHFGRRGTNNLHTFLVPLIGHSPDPVGEHAALNTRVTGMRPIAKLYPPNILPAEIDTDHPERLRGLVVDSGNPLVTAADTDAYRRAFARLDVSVVIDVAMTETARHADFVLPATNQFEKAEATFFNLGFPDNPFHLRRPLFPPLEGTLGEPEIYRRLCAAMGAIPDRFPILERAARMHRARPSLRLLPAAIKAAMVRRPELKPFLAVVLYRVLGPALPEGLAPAAVLWGSAMAYADRYPEAIQRAGIRDAGAGLGEALFQAILDGEHGVVMSEHRDDEAWSLVRHDGQRVHVAIDEMLDEMDALRAEEARPGAEFPLLLMAGERRSYNANTIYRDPAWRKQDVSGAAKFHPDDAEALGVTDGDTIRLESRTGAVDATVQVTEEMLPGVVSVPHGYGMEHTENGGDRERTGPRINELTDGDHCDPLTKTPYHKTVPIRAVVPPR